ncbi:MAG: small ribosomal subunit Rsm22 family protein [Spirochaetota bacterium]
MSRPDSGAARGLSLRLPSLIDAWRRERNLIGRSGVLDPKEIEGVGATLLGLQRGLTSSRRLAGAGYMDDGELLGAYLLYYWPVTYLQVSLALASIGRPLGRVLDLGAGPGPASAACVDHGATRAHLVDGSARALAVAKGLLEAPGIEIETSHCDFEVCGPEAGSAYDTIVASHLLNELWKDQPDRVERRLSFIEGQAGGLVSEGFLLLIEPALLATSREHLALRDALAGKGWRILAPCPNSLPCPLLASGEQRSCHGEAAWNPGEHMASLARRAGLDRSSVKWSWFAASPPGKAQAVNAPSGLDAAVGSRVVSEGLLNKAGRQRYLLCSGGSLSTLSAARDSRIARESGFLGLGRYDQVAVVGGEKRENGIGLIETSELSIIKKMPGTGP